MNKVTVAEAFANLQPFGRNPVYRWDGRIVTGVERFTDHTFTLYIEVSDSAIVTGDDLLIIDSDTTDRLAENHMAIHFDDNGNWK